MKVIFGTTNKRKLSDMQSILQQSPLDLEILTLADIGWDGEIEETKTTLEENSLLKAKTIYDFCQEHKLFYPIFADDGGLFVKALGGKPGVYTARYADEDRKKDPTLPPYQALYKLLEELKGVEDREATYRCVVTCMFPNGEYFQEQAASVGMIAQEITEPITRPYFYSLFLMDGIPFHQLSQEQLEHTYRYTAIRNSVAELERRVLKQTDSKKETHHAYKKA